MDRLKERSFRLLEGVGQKCTDYQWPFSDQYSKPVLIDCIEQKFVPWIKNTEDFNGENGMLANPTNWCIKDTKDFYSPVVSNDWQSETLKVYDDIFIRVRREMIYDHRIKEC